MMGVIKPNAGGLKIVFIIGLLLAYLVFIFKPSLSRFLAYSVMVEVNTVSQVRKNIQKRARQCALSQVS